jgi:molecular chaperone HtpG
LATKIVETQDTDAQKAMIKQAVDIAKLSMNLLKGEELTEFVKRSFEKL